MEIPQIRRPFFQSFGRPLSKFLSKGNTEYLGMKVAILVGESFLKYNVTKELDGVWGDAY